MLLTQLLIFIALCMSPSQTVHAADDGDTHNDAEDDLKLVFVDFLADVENKDPSEVDPANPRTMPPIPNPSVAVLVVWVCLAVVVVTFVLALVVVLVVIIWQEVMFKIRTKNMQSRVVEHV